MRTQFSPPCRGGPDPDEDCGIELDGRVHVCERLLMRRDGPLLEQSLKAAAGALDPAAKGASDITRTPTGLPSGSGSSSASHRCGRSSSLTNSRIFVQSGNKRLRSGQVRAELVSIGQSGEQSLKRITSSKSVEQSVQSLRVRSESVAERKPPKDHERWRTSR
jgi:hypothetical protein